MRILDANNLKYKNDILNLILKIKKLDWTEQQLDAWLAVNLGTDIFGAWLAVDEELVGVLTCEVIEQETEPKVFINFWWSKPKTNCRKELLEKCEEWSKENGFERIVFYAGRSYRKLEKDYGFHLERTVLSKDIAGE